MVVKASRNFVCVEGWSWISGPFPSEGGSAQISMFPLRRIVKTKLWTKTGHAEQSEHYTRCNVFGAARHFLQGSATACFLVEWLKLQNAERSVKKTTKKRAVEYFWYRI